jgi:hypothetical protein
MGTIARSDLREAIANSAVLRAAAVPLAALIKNPEPPAAHRRHVRNGHCRGPVSGKDHGY